MMDSIAIGLAACQYYRARDDDWQRIARHAMNYYNNKIRQYRIQIAKLESQIAELEMRLNTV